MALDIPTDHYSQPLLLSREEKQAQILVATVLFLIITLSLRENNCIIIMKKSQNGEFQPCQTLNPKSKVQSNCII